GHTTIAGHIHHLSSSLALSTLGLRGQPTSRDRSRSWTVSRVDDAAWTDLQARLRREYETLLVVVETHALWDEDALGVAIGAIAQAAYPLRPMRQRLAPRDAESLPWPRATRPRRAPRRRPRRASSGRCTISCTSGRRHSRTRIWCGTPASWGSTRSGCGASSSPTSTRRGSVKTS